MFDLNESFLKVCLYILGDNCFVVYDFYLSLLICMLSRWSWDFLLLLSGLKEHLLRPCLCVCSVCFCVVLCYCVIVPLCVFDNMLDN